MLLSDSVVIKLPFMHGLIEECKNRKSIHKRTPGCPSCKGPLYLDDLVAKAISMLSSLGDNDKSKFKSFIGTSEDIFIVSKNGKKTQIT